jgi:hypothetical protein
MNKERRNKLEALNARIGELKMELESLKDEEANYRDMWTLGTIQYTKADSAAALLENAADSMECAIDEIDGAIND